MSMQEQLDVWWDKLPPFIQARVKLTGWYMVMFLGLIVFFTYLTFQAKQSAYVRVYTVLNSAPDSANQVVEFQDRYAEFNKRFQQRVILFDIGLVLLGAYLSYQLSGKTLKPVQTMLDEQQAFAADVSHSLRTPITTMQMELAAFERSQKRIPAKVREMMGSLGEELSHMKRITQGVLSLTRATHTALEEPKRLFDLSALTRKTVEVMQPLARARDQQLQLKAKANVKIKGNADDVRQVLSILIDNALKYSQKQSLVTVGLSTNRSQVRLAVSDQGPGIDPKLKKRLFLRHQRGEQGQGHIQGTGLGLAIAKKIVELHGGDIQVKSKLGAGTTFSILLPKTSRA